MLTYEMARRMVDAAVAYAGEHGLSMTVAVVDQGGNLVALARMDHTSFMGPEVVQGKAYGAVAFCLPSGELAKRAEANPVFYSSLSAATDGRFIAAQGGLPITVDGQVIGAIAASGSKPPVDEDVARAGLRTLQEADQL